MIGYFIFCSPRGFSFPFKLVFYFILMALNKLKIMRELSLVNWGIRIFLSGIDRDKLLVLSSEYAFHIKTNKVYKELYKYEHRNDQKIVISSCFREYLEPLFPDALVICTEIKYSDNKPEQVLRHCYGDERLAMLAESGIDAVDECYANLSSDVNLMKIAENKFLVIGDTVIRCLTDREFLTLAKK